MAVRVAINGFGRIGRLAFRQMFKDPEYEIVAINDLTSPKMLAYLLKYDSTHGKFPGTVEATETSIKVDGKEITIYKEKDAANLPWADLKVDVVLECTGFYTSKEKSMAHIKAGARKVVISAPAGKDLPTIVFNVNHKILKPTDQIISAASCTTNCLAPMAIGLVIPELDGKLNGAAQRVPVPTGSTTILDAVVQGKVTADEVNAQMKKEETPSFEYNTDDIVSQDIVNSTAGSIFDATQTKVLPMGDKTLVQVVSWYDNENSYTSQMVRTIKYFSELK